MIAPGGGYNILAWDLEGDEVAEWLNTIGVTGIVLKYRVPRRPGEPKDKPPLGPLQDAQRAVSLVRGKAKEWGIDPNRIGMLGFSAGGHLTAWAATNSDQRSYEPIDDVDKVSCRPDFAVLVYPGVPASRRASRTSSTPRSACRRTRRRGSSPTPTTTAVLAGEQRADVPGAEEAKVPAELHVYSTGGHGFGLRPEGKPCATWPQRCEEWMTAQGLLTARSNALARLCV